MDFYRASLNVNYIELSLSFEAVADLYESDFSFFEGQSHQKVGRRDGEKKRYLLNENREQVPLTRQISIKSVSQYPKVSFILDNAAIKKAFIKKKWVVANCFDDEAALRRQNKNPQDYRSEIVHEALKEILDSRINGHGLVGAIYVKIANGVLFEVKPHVRIPRTLPRFNGLMCNGLLEKSRIRTNENETLMRVVEEPVTRHLPTNSRIIGISNSSHKLVDVNCYINAASDDMHLVFVVGACASQEINQKYIDDIISVTDYPLEPQARTDLICRALERKWKIF
ncbi:Ribosomal RNA small subunit methyltransferase NEP1 [Sesamum angolense]|uniref:Ribosomal RNA small subunit methyltransferase NEP1 n=1 Tax=Sesamum angolense TaxID=2727404 RepID=A0AAE1WJT9_9LAMI|nr:Ribosomal RNA small subunit methyltransferase NEP1 [Sesamum angolense]